MDGVKAALVGSGVAAFGIVSAFIGGLINQKMSRNTQHEQWLLDQRKEEWRELLSTLTRSYTLHLHGRRTAETDAEALTVIRDRLYIAVEVQDLRVLERWSRISKDPRTQMLVMEGPFNELITDIVVSALKMPESRIARILKRKR